MYMHVCMCTLVQGGEQRWSVCNAASIAQHLICPQLEVLHSGEEKEQVILHLRTPGIPEIAVKDPPSVPTEDVRYILHCAMELLVSV